MHTYIYYSFEGWLVEEGCFNVGCIRFIQSVTAGESPFISAAGATV